MRIIIRHDPLTAEQHNDLGVAYLNEKQIAAAEREFKAAIKKDPRYWLASYNLGTLYLQSNQFRNADHYLYKTVVLNPEYTDAYNNLAISLMKQKINHRALYFANLALRYSKDQNYRYLDTLISIHDALGDAEQKCSALKAIVQIAPDSFKESYQIRYNNQCLQRSEP